MDDGLDWKQITFENAKSLSKLTILVEQTSRDVGKLAKHEAKIDRLITQNGEIKEAIGSIRDGINNDKKKLKWVYTIATYPKLSLAFVLGSYTFAISDVRDAIGIQLQPLINFIKLIKDIL